MKKTASHHLIYLFLFLSIVTISCKKKDPEPAPTVVADNVNMGTESVVTINVLANDTYKDIVRIEVAGVKKYGKVAVNANNTLTFTANTNFYGTAKLQYTVTDNNGSSTGSIIIKRGTDAQIKTAEILNALASEITLYLYAIDGDSSRIYTPAYESGYFGFDDFTTNKLLITSDDVMPIIRSQRYIIVGDGNVICYDAVNTATLFTVLDYFTASAKRLNSDDYMPVKGFSIEYNGTKLDYTTIVN
jgi:hypothetical protein